MPRKQRDYRAEYQRAKEIARAEGYRSPRERKTQRRRARTVQARNNRTVDYGAYKSDRDATSLAWSAVHSRTSVTEFDPGWTEAQKNDYYDTFIETPNRGRKDKDIYRYLRRWEPDYADQMRDHYL